MAANPKRVLVGYDGSSSAQRALDAAARLIGYGSTLAVVSVAARGTDAATAALDEARETLRRCQLTATYLPLYGDAADEIVDTVQALDADLVVVGGRTQNGHLQHGLGQVSGEVVQRAPCDVLVVK